MAEENTATSTVADQTTTPGASETTTANTGDAQETGAALAAPPPTPLEIPVRKSAKDFILERKEAKRQALEEENRSLREKLSTYEDPDHKSDPVIDEKIDTTVNPLATELSEMQYAKEKTELFNEIPEAKEFEKELDRYASHEAWQKIPIKQLFYAIAGDKLISIGAENARQALTSANQSGVSGLVPRDGLTGGANAWEKSKADFDAEVRQVKAGRE